jgi:hypothetical protein
MRPGGQHWPARVTRRLQRVSQTADRVRCRLRRVQNGFLEGASVADERIDVLVLRDSGGASYALPWALVEGARLPDEEAAELARLLDGGDVSGFALNEGLPGNCRPFGELPEMTDVLTPMMDRLSNVMSTLSNLLKKQSDTADGIT